MDIVDLLAPLALIFSRLQTRWTKTHGPSRSHLCLLTNSMDTVELMPLSVSLPACIIDGHCGTHGPSRPLFLLTNSIDIVELLPILGPFVTCLQNSWTLHNSWHLSVSLPAYMSNGHCRTHAPSQYLYPLTSLMDIFKTHCPSLSHRCRIYGHYRTHDTFRSFCPLT